MTYFSPVTTASETKCERRVARTTPHHGWSRRAAVPAQATRAAADERRKCRSGAGQEGRRRFGWERETSEGRREASIVDTYSVPTVRPEERGPVFSATVQRDCSARATDPGTGTGPSRTAELTRGEVQNEQRSQ